MGLLTLTVYEGVILIKVKKSREEPIIVQLLKIG